MKPAGKYLKILLWLNIIAAVAGYLVFSIANLRIFFNDYLSILLAFSVISYVIVYIFLRGQDKDARSQTFFSLTAVSLKMLLDLFLALIWFALAKNNSLTDVLIFFVLYLTLTLTSVFFILNELKKKRL